MTREELWFCMRKSGVCDKCVRLVEDMYDDSKTVVRCVVGVADWFKMGVGLHQRPALRPFLFAIMVGRLTDEIRKEPLWTEV